MNYGYLFATLTGAYILSNLVLAAIEYAINPGNDQ